MLGVYYLHTNGDLIWKPQAVFTNITIYDYMDSPFVVAYWIIPDGSPTGNPEGDVMWMMDWLYEAYQLSNDKTKTEKRIREICESNEFPDVIADAVIKGKKKD